MSSPLSALLIDIFGEGGAVQLAQDYLALRREEDRAIVATLDAQLEGADYTEVARIRIRQRRLRRQASAFPRWHAKVNGCRLVWWRQSEAVVYRVTHGAGPDVTPTFYVFPKGSHRWAADRVLHAIGETLSPTS